MALLKQCVFIVEISPHFLAKIGFNADDIYNFFLNAGFKAQFGRQQNQYQWDDIFYHPDHTNEVNISEAIY
jgi:hypothetical protein